MSPNPSQSAVFRWSVFVVLALLTASRAPLLILEPRMMAEEASVYLAYAYDHGVLASLMFVPTSEGPAGYLHLVANLTAVLQARMFPLESAAAVSTAIAFLIQLIPFALVLWGSSRLWSKSPARRWLACALLLFGPAISPSVWLSTINAQVFCGIASLLILLEEPARVGRYRRWLYRGLLVFNGLSGPYTALFAPGFVWRAWRMRSREAWAHVVIVGATGALQLLCYVYAGLGSELAPDRLAPLLWATAVASILVFHVLGALLGNELADLVGEPLGLVVLPDYVVPTTTAPWGVLLLASLALVLAGLGLLRGRRSWVLEVLLLNFVVMSVSLSQLAHGLPWRRYSVVPGVLFLMVILIGGWEAERTLRRTVCRALLSVALMFGLVTFWRDAPMHLQDFTVTNFGHAPGRPDWRQEVAAWRRDPAVPLRVWPFAGSRTWKAYLAQPGDFQRVRLEPSSGWRLIALQEPVERRVRVLEPPGDFRVHVTGKVSVNVEDLDVSVLLIDGSPEPAVLARRRIHGVDADGKFEVYLNPNYLEQRNAVDSAARFVVLRVGRPSRDGLRVVFDRIAVVPRIEGLLDRWGFETTLTQASPVGSSDRQPARRPG